jgi:hypothetical protein
MQGILMTFSGADGLRFRRVSESDVQEYLGRGWNFRKSRDKDIFKTAPQKNKETPVTMGPSIVD